jgi:rhodanese-related sulfurtransferase
MKYFHLMIAMVMVGCGDTGESLNKTPKIGIKPSANQKPDHNSPPKHTKDPLPLIKERISKNEAILVDVREKNEWDEGHLQSAIFLPLSGLKEGGANESFASKLAVKLPKDKIVYCHCVSGGRVLPASAILQRLGYDTRPLKSGYELLLKAGFENAK